jgi:hypothetical protein
MTPLIRRLACSVLCAATATLIVACATDEDDQYVRGHKLRPAGLSATERASVYKAALAAAFEVDDPALTLLLDRRVLPRIGGMGEEGRVAASTERALRDGKVIHGLCEPPITESRKTPVCQARGPGYVVRFSDVFRRGGDSVEVHLAVQKFDTPSSGASESLHFERAYQLVGGGDHWRAAREARVRATDVAPASR